MYELESRNDATLIRVRGDVDFSTRRPFRKILELAQRYTVWEIIVNLEECSYFDASGLSELIRANNAWSGHFTVVLPKAGLVQRVFSITDLDRTFGVKTTAGDVALGLVS